MQLVKYNNNNNLNEYIKCSFIWNCRLTKQILSKLLKQKIKQVDIFVMMDLKLRK